MGRAVGAAAAGDESERRAVDEAVEALDVAHIVEGHVVVHGDGAAASQRAVPVMGAVRLVQQHEALRVGGQQLGGQPLQRVGRWRRPRAVPTASTRSAWRIAFSDQGVSSGSATNST